jgi:tryptophan 2,3-dioxygenase
VDIQTFMSLTYSSYLKINDLLDIQHCQSTGPDHDELLFIITHQVYELWFKQIIHEIDHLIQLFTSAERHRALHTLKRLEKILKTLTQQVDILETLTPLEFNSFREQLATASGLQSIQFREMEMALGLKQEGKWDVVGADTTEKERLRLRYNSPSLWDAFIQFLDQIGHAPPTKQLKRDFTLPITTNKKLQTLLVHIYRNDPLTSEICEALVDIDEGLQEWRYRHVKMVERTIGTKIGTGGSSGADYLQSTLFKPLWPDLWGIRKRL